MNLDYYDIAKILKMIKVFSLFGQICSSYIKIFTGEHFSKFSVIYAVTSTSFREEELPWRKAFRKKREGTQGLREKKKFATAQEWLVQEKGGGDICWWNDFLEIIKCIHPEITHITIVCRHMASLKTRETLKGPQK